MENDAFAITGAENGNLDLIVAGSNRQIIPIQSINLVLYHDLWL
jgi:hypothetical protein